MCGRAPSRESGYMELRENMCFFNISVLFIADATSILKSVFLTVYSFCLDDQFGGCVVAIIVGSVVAFFFAFYLFTYLFTFSVRSTNILVFVVVVVIATVAFAVGVIIAFFVRVVIVVVAIMFLFSIVVFLCVP